MTSMNPVSSGGFASAAGHYAAVRPAYARGAIGLIKETLVAKEDPGHMNVLDVAAGTGILTGALTRAGVDTVAVEPLPEMFAQLLRALPNVPVVRAVAEALPFPDTSFTGLTIAQAFHWMDYSLALAEAQRVLVPGGVLALIWNARDESVQWVRDLTDLLERRCGGRPYSDHREQSWVDVVSDAGGFSHISTTRYPNPVASSPQGVAERVLSTSFVAVMESEARDSLIDEVRELIATSPELDSREAFNYPHDTVLHLWRRQLVR